MRLSLQEWYARVLKEGLRPSTVSTSLLYIVFFSEGSECGRPKKIAAPIYISVFTRVVGDLFLGGPSA